MIYLLEKKTNYLQMISKNYKEIIIITIISIILLSVYLLLQKNNNKKCPNNCSSNGICENGKCICNSSYFGDDCISQKTWTCNDDNICCPQNNETGEYKSEESCKTICSNRTYDCANGYCRSNSIGTGQFPSKQLCKKSCKEPPKHTYSCYQKKCIVDDESGTYNTDNCDGLCIGS
jgi:hypothetical protein